MNRKLWYNLRGGGGEAQTQTLKKIPLLRYPKSPVPATSPREPRDWCFCRLSSLLKTRACTLLAGLVSSVSSRKQQRARTFGVWRLGATRSPCRAPAPGCGSQLCSDPASPPRQDRDGRGHFSLLNIWRKYPGNEVGTLQIRTWDTEEDGGANHPSSESCLWGGKAGYFHGFYHPAQK